LSISDKTKGEIMFKTGDVVRLKSGGPKMTVQRLIGDNDPPTNALIDNHLKVGKGVKVGDPICQWFADGDLKSDAFKEGMIELAAETKA
jgi:uncharacterized protein YodC (DUF2158 family)